ncbi:CRISPR-associated protein Cas5 [Intestinimonas butyriciproducens]|nr:CRISPR-associated protein Cas5 [Enterocloster bolteae]MCB7235179.1 CRISPR-associated protein Cas5 [Enterocloster bolteae]
MPPFFYAVFRLSRPMPLRTAARGLIMAIPL